MNSMTWEAFWGELGSRQWPGYCPTRVPSGRWVDVWARAHGGQLGREGVRAQVALAHEVCEQAMEDHHGLPTRGDGQWPLEGPPMGRPAWAAARAAPARRRDGDERQVVPGILSVERGQSLAAHQYSP